MISREELKEAWIIDPSFRFYQHPSHFCFNTDTVLLAKFARVNPGDTVMDVGCNNGALLVWLDQFDPKELIGVEILPQSAEVAEFNAGRFLKNHCTILQEDVRTLKHDPVDLIVCNPPYFPVNQSPAEEKATLRQKGRVEYTLQLEDLAKAASRLLKTGGRLALVHRPERTVEIIEALRKYRLNPSRLAYVYDRRDRQCKSVLMEAVYDRSPQLQVEVPIWIGEEPHD